LARAILSVKTDYFIEIHEKNNDRGANKSLIMSPKRSLEVCSVSYYYSYYSSSIFRHFEFFFNPQKLPHTTVDIPTNLHEV
jgi:hypothetical protein